MNEYFQENKRSLFILVLLLFILAIVLYIFLLHPLLDKYSKTEKNITQLNSEIDVLEAKLANTGDDEPSEIDFEQLMLEKKIPQERELDNYILSLQQLELVSHSKIEEVQFAYDSSLDISDEEELEDETQADNQDESETDQTDDTETDDETDDSEEPKIDPEILKEKPEQLHVMTVRLTAISPTYDDFIDLVKEIEKTERISIVTSLDFVQPTEVDEFFTDNPEDIIAFEAELTTFYYAE